MNIVFDLDGTLVDSAPDLMIAANRMLESVGKAPLDLATITSFVGNGLPKLALRALRARGVPESEHKRLIDMMREHYNAAPAEHTGLYPGVMQALEGLKAGGHRLGLCTNKPEEPTRHILEAMGLGGYFETIVAGDTLAVKKPDPAPLCHAFAALGGGARLYVGDSEIDAETATRAGVAFALFTEGYRKAPVEALPHSFRFADFTALPGLVAAHAGNAAPV